MATLQEKLQAANIPCVTADENGSVDFSGLNLRNEQINQMMEIIAEHVNPAEYAVRKRVAECKVAAKGEAALAKQLKTVTAQGAVDYIEANVTNLASAKAVMKIMARMLIALRDAQFPELPEE